MYDSMTTAAQRRALLAEGWACTMLGSMKKLEARRLAESGPTPRRPPYGVHVTKCLMAPGRQFLKGFVGQHSIDIDLFGLPAYVTRPF